MPRKKTTLATIDRNAVFQNVKATALLSGLSVSSIYQGCREGNIPSIRRGSDWFINYPLWLETLNAESRGMAYERKPES